MNDLRVACKRPGAIVLLGAVLMGLLGLSVSSASALSLSTGNRQLISSQTRCTSQTVAVTTTATTTTASSVTVSNVDVTRCGGLPIVVAVYDSTAATWATAKKFEVSGSATVASITLPSPSASFTPTVAQKVYATIGGWPVAATWTYTPPTGPVNVCQVRNASDGSLDSTKPCTVTGPIKSDYWGSSGSGQGNFRTNVSAPGILNSQYVSFTITLSGAPSWWSWSNAGLTRINNSGVVTSSCSTLPTVSGRLGANIGASPDVYVDIVENRTGTPGLVCQVP